MNIPLDETDAYERGMDPLYGMTDNESYRRFGSK